MTTSPHNSQIAAELQAAIIAVRENKTGWLSVKPYWFTDQSQLVAFMSARGKKGLPILEARLAEVSQ